MRVAAHVHVHRPPRSFARTKRRTRAACFPGAVQECHTTVLPAFMYLANKYLCSSSTPDADCLGNVLIPPLSEQLQIVKAMHDVGPECRGLERTLLQLMMEQEWTKVDELEELAAHIQRHMMDVHRYIDHSESLRKAFSNDRNAF